ncbi:unnamed protein product [Aureobasidium uvarum]|uniref:Uncharacterized protein n=1 Tax=Aureobasidium uvarum TaxID=2773716 RepID=A0A9N8PNW6_9PEZI|nr:unnamed protein product [Aureobasidium uvarum]
MSDEMAFAGVPAREDCSSCPEIGERCALHQSMYLRALERQREPGVMTQNQQVLGQERGEHLDQRASKQSKLSKDAAREANRVKTQEGQMISVSLYPSPLAFFTVITIEPVPVVDAHHSQALKRMNFNESRRLQELTRKQKKRNKRREDAVLNVSDPVKIAARQEKAAQRAADPKRLAKLEAHKEKVAENRARALARRSRLVEQHRQQNKSSILMDDIVASNEVVDRAPAMQTSGTDNDYSPSDPARRTRGQKAAREVQRKLQDLATVHSMPENTGSDAFLVRADCLIDQTLASSISSLSPTDRKNLEEALSLVRTVQLLSTKDYSPWQNTSTETLDRVIRGPEPRDQLVYKHELSIEDVPIKQEYASESSFTAQENSQEQYGRLRGGASGGFGVFSQDAMEG